MEAQERFYLENIWYCVLPGKNLKPGRMQNITLAKKPILLARRDDGSVFALRDICPHRGIPLTDGWFDGQEVTCCYHGWRFDGCGKCTDIPSIVTDQNFDIARVSVANYAAAEVQGNIWVYLGPADKADPADIPRLPGFDDSKKPGLVIEMDFPCHVDHAVIGLMDPAHGPFVHQSWFWRSRKTMHEKAKKFGPVERGFAMLRHKPSSNSFAYKLLGGERETEISFTLPGIRREDFTAGEKRVGLLTSVTPVDDENTKVTVTIFWNTWIGTALKPLLAVFGRIFLGQDRDVVIKQQKGLKFDPPLMLIADADVQARWYYRLKKEHRMAIEEDRPFDNPVKERVLKWCS